jgi:Putative beta-barrel porin 2
LRNSLVAVFAAIALLRVAPAFAQASDGGPDTANVRVRIGPFMMNPTVSINNIGIDHNVFNDPASNDPKQDFTVTVTPATDIWLRVGPTWVTASLNESINWYQKYANQRSANGEYKLGWIVPGSLISFKINGVYLSARERPGFEIDTRVGRTEVTYNGSFEYHALSQTYIGLTGSRERTRFASDAAFLDTNLEVSLNRVTTTAGANLRYQLTSLTSVTFSATRSMDRFEFSPQRDSNSTSGQASIILQPGALLKGGVTIGYSDFKPIASDLPSFSGVTGLVDLTYVLLGSTRFGIRGSRGVQYSYEVNEPYYLQTGVIGSVAQQIFGPVDVEVRGGLQLLAYRDRQGADVTVTDRSDHVSTYGVGVGFHMGTDFRLAFNVDKVNRDSRLEDRTFNNFKFGTALTYGF